MPSAGKLVAVGNLKGGVGKTTLAVSIACALPDRGGGGRCRRQASALAWAAAGSYRSR